MRRLLKKKVRIFEREISVLLIALIAVIGIGSAALLTYFGQIEQEFTVGKAVTFNDDSCADNICTETVEELGACGSAISDLYKIESETSAIVPLSISTEINPEDEGIATTTEYVLNPEGNCSGDDCEQRVFIDGEDVGIETLSDFNSMSWDVNVLDGYIAHVDVIIDTDGDGERDDALVFEYAKVDLANCDNPPYPDGEMDTFGDNGIVDNDAYAWLTTGPAGPCGADPTVFFHHSLSDWKAGPNPTEANGKTIDGDTKVIGFEIEVDNWIENSESKVMNIQINGADVEVSLLPEGFLNFDILTEVDCLIENTGAYDITTTVTAR